jgi:hypothetical protein
MEAAGRTVGVVGRLLARIMWQKGVDIHTPRRLQGDSRFRVANRTHHPTRCSKFSTYIRA